MRTLGHRCRLALVVPAIMRIRDVRAFSQRPKRLAARGLSSARNRDRLEHIAPSAIRTSGVRPTTSHVFSNCASVREFVVR